MLTFKITTRSSNFCKASTFDLIIIAKLRRGPFPHSSGITLTTALITKLSPSVSKPLTSSLPDIPRITFSIFPSPLTVSESINTLITTVSIPSIERIFRYWPLIFLSSFMETIFSSFSGTISMDSSSSILRFRRSRCFRGAGKPRT